MLWKLCKFVPLLACVVRQLFSLLPNGLLDRLGEDRPNADFVDRAEYLVLVGVLALFTNLVDVKPVWRTRSMAGIRRLAWRSPPRFLFG